MQADFLQPEAPAEAQSIAAVRVQRMVLPLRCYYQDSHCAIIHADCREILADGKLPKANLALTDPPYGVGVKYASFDDTKLNLRQLIGESIELIRRAADAVLLTPGNQNLWTYPEPDHVLAWMCPAGAGCGKWGFTCWHAVLAYGRDPYRPGKEGSRPDAWMHMETAEKNGHPCPKPISAWSKLLVRGSVNEDDLILDPFMGSGTTLLAAKQTNRRAIGIEIEEQYCEIAAKRLAQGVML